MDNRNLAKFALSVAKEATQNMEEHWGKFAITKEKTISNRTNPSSQANEVPFERNEIFDALAAISPALANSYAQVKMDITDTNRVSWAGSAHEIREIISSLLRQLAPDDEVKKQRWFIQDPSTKGITRAQRTRYLIQLKNLGSNRQEVIEKDMNMLEDRISGLVNSIYNRASEAAHMYEDQDEVFRILGYFEALIHDLLVIKIR